MRGLAAWLDARTGCTRLGRRLLDEAIPPGTGWLFTLGSVLLALLAVQILTGAFLALYYAPTPDHAYDSVRFIDRTPGGRMVRGLHHYGASFILVAILLHLLRVVALGSFKPPRELTWLSGLVLLGIVLVFAMTGHLLPWDQRAYWATIVTINIARLMPGVGDMLAWLLQGGATLGALTLTRWYAVHVVFLPAALALLVGLHIALMRKQGVSGPLRPSSGSPLPFYPFHAARDAVAASLVLVALAAVSWQGTPPLDGPADPTDATYVPRPAWYFLGLFELLKYFPGRWEVLAAVGLPALAVTLLALLPWIDRGPERHPARRRAVIGLVLASVLGLVALTAAGLRDAPSTATEAWTLREIAGRPFVARAGCARCHGPTGVAGRLDPPAAGRGPEWLAAHIVDPEMIAPGLRNPPAPPHEREVAAILAYVRRSLRDPYPHPETRVETAAAVYARHCIGCHIIDGEGGRDGPELTSIGREHDAATLRAWIADPESLDPDADMPAFANRLTTAELDAIAGYLAGRR